MDRDIYVTIHGHFYQPPRENPWLDFIERQPSAYPYHDWNERIAAECYTPNTVSRILDPQGRIDTIVNNFEYLNFDIGPTLFGWLERYAPRTYKRILEGDRLSRTRNGGHGGAIAQAFGHMILPLANDDDLETQIAWGIKDFARRFRREPEGMWLPETAANNRVMAALQRHGILYTILAPSQAQSVRAMGEGSWKDVAGDSIDTHQPYRYFVRNEKGEIDRRKYVDVFFFHNPLSRAMSFEHIMTNAGKFADSVRGASIDGKAPQLVGAATDGETFGHHEPFADMCLASFFDREAQAKGLKVVNFAYYLEMFPPTSEVELKAGPGGEGTAWSCAHGTGRWQRDCGCATGGPSWWNQRWRAPLRRAFDNLRVGLDDAMRRGLSGIVSDPKAARNDYVDVVLDRNEETLAAFLDRHVKKDTPEGSRVRVLELMESQKNAMYMYTSCGWFFSELSGLEPVQNMRYAARAIELADKFAAKPLMQSFLADLAEAPSNIEEMKDGRTVFRRLVWPSMMTMEKAVAANAMSVLLAQNPRLWQPTTYRVENVESERLPDRYPSSFGITRCTSTFTEESMLYAYYVTQFTARDVRCYVKNVANTHEYQSLKDRLQVADKATLPSIFQGNFLTWTDLLPEISAAIMGALVEDDLKALRNHFTELFEENRELFQGLVQAGVELPYEVRGMVKYALSRLVHDEILGRRGDWRRESLARAKEYVDSAKSFGVDIDTRDIDALVTEDLLAEAEAVRGDLSPRHFKNVLAILDAGRELGLSLRRDLVENIILEVLEEKVVPWIMSLKDPQRDGDDYNAITEILDCAEKLNFSRRRYAAMLAPFASALATSGKSAAN